MNIPGTSVAIIPRRILIVEDHESTAEVLSRLLLRHGHEVWKASSFAQALDVAHHEDIEVMVCDLRLPDGSGFDLLREINTHKTVKGVVLSGQGSPEDREHSRSMGFAAHLIKPLDLAELEQAIFNIFLDRKSIRPDEKDSY